MSCFFDRHVLFYFQIKIIIAGAVARTTVKRETGASPVRSRHCEQGVGCQICH